MLDITFPHRVLALVTVLAAVSGTEWWLRPCEAIRWRYSLFVLASGALGAAYGAAHDAMTVRIAPEYFSVLKGLGPTAVVSNATALGAQAGFSLGVVGAAVLCYTGERRRTKGEQPGLLPLARAWLGITKASVGLALVGGLGTHLALRNGWLDGEWAGVPNDQGRRVLTVWAVHSGTYLGAAVGLAVSCGTLYRSQLHVHGNPAEVSTTSRRTGQRVGRLGAATKEGGAFGVGEGRRPIFEETEGLRVGSGEGANGPVAAGHEAGGAKRLEGGVEERAQVGVGPGGMVGFRDETRKLDCDVVHAAELPEGP